jgi:hypothetical protein
MTVFGRIVILFSSAFLTKASRFLPVPIQPKLSQENQPVETSFLDKVEINKSDLSDEELKRGTSRSIGSNAKSDA